MITSTLFPVEQYGTALVSSLKGYEASQKNYFCTLSAFGSKGVVCFPKSPFKHCSLLMGP